MKLKFLSKLLLGVFLACGVMFFVGCSDKDDGGGTTITPDGGSVNWNGTYENSNGFTANISGDNITVTGTDVNWNGKLSAERDVPGSTGTTTKERIITDLDGNEVGKAVYVQSGSFSVTNITITIPKGQSTISITFDRY